MIMLLSVCLVSCKKKPVENVVESDTVESDATSSQYDGKVLISDKGAVNYSIVYADSIDSFVKEYVTDLYTILSDRSGNINIDIKTVSANTYDTDAREILIGNTGYAETNEVMNSTGYGDYRIKFVGNKLVVAGFSRSALRSGIAMLMFYIKNGDMGDGTIALDENLNMSEEIYGIANNVPKFTDGKFPIVTDEGENASLLSLNGMNAEGYNAYLKTLEQNGYSLYTSNTIKGNEYSTYENGEYVINTSYHEYNSTVQTVIEKKTSLPSLQKDNVYVKNDSVVTSMAMIGCQQLGGSGYVYQLADGSFLAIDSGYSEDGETIYEYMSSKAPDGKIVIAAWVITHPHKDHFQGFDAFVKNHGSQVTVEQVIMNFPGVEMLEDSGDYNNTSVGKSVSKLEGCKLIKAHAGQKFYIRNAVLEILYTYENKFPDKLTNLNDASIICTVDCEGERALFMADGSDPTAKILNAMYGDYLKADILQLAHHGYGTNWNNMKAMHTIVRPEILLWPDRDKNFIVDNMTNAKHPWIKEAMLSAREVYMAEGTIVLELPYNIWSAYKFDPNEVRQPVHSDKISSSDKLEFTPSSGQQGSLEVDWNDSTVS